MTMSLADLPRELLTSPCPISDSPLFWGLVAIIMGLLSYFRPGGRISFYHPKDNHLLLTRKSEKPDVKNKQVTFAEICREATPSKIRLNPFLFNGHLQTAWTVLKHDGVPVYYKRRAFESENPMYSGQFALDFTVKPYEIPDDDILTDRARKYTQPSGLPERTSFFSRKANLLLCLRMTRNPCW